MVLPDLRRRSEDDSERAWSEVVAGVLQLGSVCANLPPELMVIVEDDGATQRVLSSAVISWGLLGGGPIWGYYPRRAHAPRPLNDCNSPSGPSAGEIH